MPVLTAINDRQANLIYRQGPAARMADAREAPPVYVGPVGVAANVPLTAQQVGYAGMLRALKVPAVVNNHARLDQITDILAAHQITARDVYEVLRDLDHTVEVPSPDHLPSPDMMRRTMAAMIEIRLNFTRAQALDAVDKGRSANVGAIAALIGTEIVIGTIVGVQGAGCLYVMGCAKAGVAAKMAALKGGAASVGGIAKTKALAGLFGWGGVLAVATLWGVGLVTKGSYDMYMAWNMSPEALFLQRTKDAAIVSHVVDGVVFRQAPRGYYDQHPAQ